MKPGPGPGPMRIIAGKHRGRRLEALGDDRVRPTADRAREALFNILVHGDLAPGGVSPIAGALVLDAFCGSGALGLEALSRGAAHASFMDSDRAVLEAVRRNAEHLGEDRATVALVRADATAPPPAGAACAVAFLDPPYGKGLAGPALAALAAAGWLAPGAIAVVEQSSKEAALAPPADFERLDARDYGAARLIFLRYGARG